MDGLLKTIEVEIEQDVSDIEEDGHEFVRERMKSAAWCEASGLVTLRRRRFCSRHSLASSARRSVRAVLILTGVVARTPVWYRSRSSMFPSSWPGTIW